MDVLGVREDHAALVEQPINAELDARSDDPAEGAIVVIDGVRDQQWVVGSRRRIGQGGG